MITVLNKLIKPTPSKVYETYWKFAAERQHVFYRRLYGEYPPWTKDHIIRVFKFTNVYRVTDRVSQYLVKEIIEKGDQNPKEVLFRILLFKLFNKIDTWENLAMAIGEIRFDSYDNNLYARVLDALKSDGKRIYSGAYIMASAQSAFGHKYKHQNHLKLLETIMTDKSFERIQDSESLEFLYQNLKTFPSIGPFLAYQLAIDINYSNITDFSEMEFVKAGPGAKDGIRKCFDSPGQYSDEDIIKMVTYNQSEEFNRFGLSFKDLYGRPLQLIDCQNIFCEVDKYSRVMHPDIIGVSNRVRIKQKFQPSSLKPIKYQFPKKWKLTGNI